MENYRTSINSGDPTAKTQANATQFVPALDGWYDFVADFEDELDDGKATFSRREVTVQKQLKKNIQHTSWVLRLPVQCWIR
jgi:hypothetical protein